MAHKDWIAVKRAVGWFCAGAIVCGVFYAIQQQFVLPPVTEGAYSAEGNADAVPGILAAVGEGDQSSAEAVSAALERDLDQTGDRLRRWLSERR